MAETERDDGGPAFACEGGTGYPPSPGMSLRDWFAGQALAGICANPDISSHAPKGFTASDLQESYATSAYATADAMLAERAK